MTIIYSKRTGNIKNIASGNLQHINTLYKDFEDYQIIWNEIIMEDNLEVLNNPFAYKINVETKQLEIVPSQIPNYPIASS